MKRILIVPQTDRNLGQLIAYAKVFVKDCELIWHSNKFYGEHLWKSMPLVPSNWQEVKWAPIDVPCRGSELYRYFRAILLYCGYRRFLQNLCLDLLVVGDDVRGMGNWAVQAAGDLRIRTIVFQEGCRFLYELHEYWLIAFKRKMFTKIPFKPRFRKVEKEFQYANHAVLWGEYFKKAVLERGGRASRISVGRHLESSKIAACGKTRRYDSSPVLFLDAPIRAWSKGSVDLTAFDRLRVEIVKEVLRCGRRCIFKMHPLTPDKDRNIIRDLFDGMDVQILEQGAAEEIMGTASCCITFPSTAVFTVLAMRLPFILVWPTLRAFKTLLWNPVDRYGAGVLIRNADEVQSALETIFVKTWLEKYLVAANNALKDVMEKGPDPAFNVLFTW